MIKHFIPIIGIYYLGREGMFMSNTVFNTLLTYHLIIIILIISSLL